MEKIDTWILENIFQRFADWFTGFFGKSSYWQAMIAHVLWNIFVIWRLVDDVHDHDTFGIFLGICVILFTIWRINELSALEKRFQSSVTWNYIDEMRFSVTTMYIRMFCVFLLFVWTGLRQEISGALLICAFYLPLCTPKKPPPKPVQEPSNDPLLIPHR